MSSAQSLMLLTVCCFDKTGTLTSDKLILSGLCMAGEADGDELLLPENVTPSALTVLGGCHSLVRISCAMCFICRYRWGLNVAEMRMLDFLIAACTEGLTSNRFQSTERLLETRWRLLPWQAWGGRSGRVRGEGEE